MLELPPRARRILQWLQESTNELGTTSACAENTLAQFYNVVNFWNYLRVRGEYLGRPHGPSDRTELPPRARRIHGLPVTTVLPCGTTSACAENTGCKLLMRCTLWNYLRVRGEYEPVGGIACKYRELPPRARRIRRGNCTAGVGFGTTSACAENTPPAEC